MQKNNTYLPRERAKTIGIEHLTDYELLALILRTGHKKQDVLECSRALLSTFGNLDNLGKASITKLQELQGIGESKAIGLLAAFEIGRRAHRASIITENKIIDSPTMCVDIFKNDFKNVYQECFMCICLNSKNEIILEKEVYRGGLSTLTVHPREIFRIAIDVSAATIILLHNHPSGDATPSLADIRATKALLAASDVIGIPILDHIIIGNDSYISLREDGFVKF